MSIETIKYDEAAPAFEFLDALALNDSGYIFRGHGKESYLLETTLNRYRPGMSWMSGIDDMIDRFRVGVTQLGIAPFDSNSRLDWLEYARHHGVPTPVLDFSYSPYIALFFAFSGKPIEHGDDHKRYTVINALHIEKLASAWATLSHDFNENHEEVAKRHREFLYPKNDLFDSGFPNRCLQFIPHPGKENRRMHRQQGALLYDTLQYTYLKFRNLEDLISAYNEKEEPFTKGMRDTQTPTLYKVLINEKCANEVFTKLELMGINGGSLYMSSDGVAQDVINSLAYHSRVNYLRDMRFPRSEI